MIKKILTDLAISISLMMVGFVLGYFYTQDQILSRCKEVMKSERVEFDGADIQYIALGVKQEELNNFKK